MEGKKIGCFGKIGIGIVILMVIGFFSSSKKDAVKEVDKKDNVSALGPAGFSGFEKAPEVSKADVAANVGQLIDEIERRYKENADRLKKYYATAENVQQARADIILLTLVDGNKSADRLLVKVKRQARVLCASFFEQIMMEKGLNMTVKAVGPDNKVLRFKYALMSDVFVYQLQNTVGIAGQVSGLEFSKIVFTNGFESDLGQTWTVKL